MVSLDRMNTILVMANSKRALEEVKRWVAKLDTTTGRSVQTFIYTVENGTASNIAQVLALLFGSGDVSTQGGAQAPGAATPMGGLGSTGQRGGTGGGSTLSGSQAGRNQFTSAVPGNNQFMGGSQGMGNLYGQGAGMGLMGGQQSIGGMRLTQGAGMTAQVLTASSFSGLQGNVRIVADDINNALIIQGSAADYDFLLETIKRMDVLPRQAIIDARIFEIDLTDGLSFGVSAALQATTSGQHLTTGSVGGDTGALSASTFAFVGSAREILMNLSALQQKTKVRILEAPSVLAVDGRTAHIQVGGSVPIPGASYVPAQGGITTSVQYAETGTTLEITPRISGSGTVTLEIAQAVTVPGASSDLGPTFSTTNVYTTLAVKDGESVAIAGLIRESDSNTRNGVPFLSSIPLMGALFGRTTRSSARTELLIMITPHVIKNPDRFREMTQKLKDSVSMAGKFADQKEAEIRENEEKARQKRLEQEQKQIKKSGQQPDQPPAKKVEAPAAGK
jgi:general secretion pathway protein D